MKKFSAIVFLSFLLMGCNEANSLETTANPSDKLEQVGVFEQHQTEITAQDKAVHLVTVPLEKASNIVQAELLEGFGVELENVSTEYNGQKISYQFQSWRIKPQSVCSELKAINIADYSSCTQAASQLFHNLCSTLKSQITSNRLRHLHTMYCNAAIEFKPTIAQISRSEPQTGKLYTLKQACNSAIIQAMISMSDQDYAKRNKVCEIYEKNKLSH